MAGRLRVAMVALVAMGALAGCSTGSDAVDQTSGSGNGFVVAGNVTKVFTAGSRHTAPAVTGTLLDGSPFDLSAERGHVVVINFWGQWCAPCRAEAPDLESAYQAEQASGVVFVGVDLRDDRSKALAFVTAHHITYPSIFDPASRVALAFRDVPPSAIPSTIVIDPTGHIAGLHLDAITRDQLTYLIDAAMK